jgi:hypothetical protein
MSRHHNRTTTHQLALAAGFSFVTLASSVEVGAANGNMCNTNGGQEPVTKKCGPFTYPGLGVAGTVIGAGSGTVEAKAIVECNGVPDEDPIAGQPTKASSGNIVQFEVMGNPLLCVVTQNPLVRSANAFVPGWANALGNAAVNGNGTGAINGNDLTIEFELEMSTNYSAECHCDLSQDASITVKATDPLVYGSGTYIDAQGQPNLALPLVNNAETDTTALGAPAADLGSGVTSTVYSKFVKQGANDDPNAELGALVWRLEIIRSPCGRSARFTVGEEGLEGFDVILSKTPAQIEAAIAAWSQGSTGVDLLDTTIVNTNPEAMPWFTVSETMEAGPGNCPKDLDGDGTVGGADLAMLLAAWGTSGASDIDGDGDVDGADLALLLAAWNTCGC